MCDWCEKSIEELKELSRKPYIQDGCLGIVDMGTKYAIYCDASDPYYSGFGHVGIKYCPWCGRKLPELPPFTLPEFHTDTSPLPDENIAFDDMTPYKPIAVWQVKGYGFFVIFRGENEWGVVPYNELGYEGFHTYVKRDRSIQQAIAETLADEGIDESKAIRINHDEFCVFIESLEDKD